MTEAARQGGWRLVLLQRDKGKCAACPRQTLPWPLVAWQVDHIVPLADGGTDTLDNLQTLCLGHHRIKTAGELVQRRKRARGYVAREPRPIRPQIAITADLITLSEACAAGVLHMQLNAARAASKRKGFPREAPQRRVARHGFGAPAKLYRRSDLEAWAVGKRWTLEGAERA